MTARISVKRWHDPALQAAAMRVGCCTDAVGLIGVDLVAQDGNTFAHGHVDIATARVLRRHLDEAIAEAERKGHH